MTEDHLSLRRRIHRVEVPSDYSEGDAWGWALAMPYRCLSGDRGFASMPAAPRPENHDLADWEQWFHQNLAYYTALQSFLTYSFGWTRHDKGLASWYDVGCPEYDPRYSLIKAIWFLDGTLDSYLAFAIAQDPIDALAPLRPWAMHTDLAPFRARRELSRRLEPARRMGIWATGSDPMHLGGGWHAGSASGHYAFGADGRPPTARARIAGIDADERTAVFVADGIDGWYGRLAEIGGELPLLADSRSWHVDVYVRPIGFVGTYRRSRQTGLWFSGQHRHHSVGN